MANGRHLAMWSHRRRGELVIADLSGAVVGSYPVQHNGDRPGPHLLRHTGWACYPGVEWEEEPPGEWSAAVFRHPLPRREPGRDARPAAVNGAAVNGAAVNGDQPGSGARPGGAWGGMVLTWKVWTDDNDPVFEGTEAQARAYVTGRLADRAEAVLESPDGDSYGYQDGVWVCLDRSWDQ